MPAPQLKPARVYEKAEELATDLKQLEGADRKLRDVTDNIKSVVDDYFSTVFPRISSSILDLVNMRNVRLYDVVTDDYVEITPRLLKREYRDTSEFQFQVAPQSARRLKQGCLIARDNPGICILLMLLYFENFDDWLRDPKTELRAIVVSLDSSANADLYKKIHARLNDRLSLYANHEIVNTQNYLYLPVFNTYSVCRNTRDPVCLLEGTISGRIGNNLCLFLSQLKDHYKSASLEKNPHLFVVANNWNANIYEQQSNTPDKFGILRDNGLYSKFRDFTHTHYQTVISRSMPSSNSFYDFFGTNQQPELINGFIARVILPQAVSPQLSKMKADPTTVHMHVRYGDFCNQDMRSFASLHFSYYTDALHAILSTDAAVSRVVLFCAEVDLFMVHMLEIYIRNKLDLHDIDVLLDRDVYTYGDLLDVNFCLANGAKYIITSNSTFSLLSLALNVNGDKEIYSPEFKFNNYGTVPLPVLRINDTVLTNHLIAAETFACLDTVESFVERIILFLFKNYPDRYRHHFRLIRLAQPYYHRLYGDVSVETQAKLELGHLTREALEAKRRPKYKFWKKIGPGNLNLGQREERAFTMVPITRLPLEKALPIYVDGLRYRPSDPAADTVAKELRSDSEDSTASVDVTRTTDDE